jgi:hypothetical protein
MSPPFVPSEVMQHPLVYGLSPDAMRVYRALLTHRARVDSTWLPAADAMFLTRQRTPDAERVLRELLRDGLVCVFEEFPTEAAVLTPAQLEGAKTFWEAEEAAR